MADYKEIVMPRYKEIPNVGLYLEQVTKYISDIFGPMDELNLTTSMVSNYVKKKLIPNPVKKQYDRDHIAMLIFIAVAKTVISMEDIRVMLELREKTSEVGPAYDYFCDEFERMLACLPGDGGSFEFEAPSRTDDAKALLRQVVTAAAFGICLRSSFAALKEE